MPGYGKVIRVSGRKGESAVSGRSGGKNWSASVLRRRGWTNELMKQLLPKPRILMSNGRPVRIWNQEEVRRAEKDRSFSQARRDPELRGAALRAAAPDVRHASRLLAAAWEEAGKDLSSAPWLLAGHYHAAILARLASVPRSRTFDQNQSVGQMREFLSLEENCTGKRMLEVLKNFLRAAPWMGECSDHAQARAALERYPQVLHSASEQVLAEFISAQPEADAEAMLRAEGFPVSQLLQEGLAAVWSVWYVPAPAGPGGPGDAAGGGGGLQPDHRGGGGFPHLGHPHRRHRRKAGFEALL